MVLYNVNSKLLSNTIISTLFEFLKITHQASLLWHCSLSVYGTIGTLFSLLFAAISFSSIALDSALPAFIHTIFSSQQNCRKIIARLVISQIFFLGVGSLCMNYIMTYFFPSLAVSTPLMILLALLAVIEGLRIVARSMLHALGIHSYPLFSELLIMVLYMGLVWIPFLMYGYFPDLTMLFSYYCICSVLALVVLSCFIYRYYTLLPKTEEFCLFPWKRFFKLRVFTYASKLSSYFFTGNVLIPFFAAHFGFSQSGIFKFASYSIDAFKGVIHTVIGFPSGALFARLKNETIEKKREAFKQASNTLHIFLLGIIIFSIMILKIHFFMTSTTPLHSVFISMSFFFFLLFISEQIIVVYEKFYLIEESSHILVAIKIIEIISVLGLLSYSSLFPLYVLCILLCSIRFLSFCTLALYAYQQWSLMPSFNIKIFSYKATNLFLILYNSISFKNLDL